MNKPVILLISLLVGGGVYLYGPGRPYLEKYIPSLRREQAAEESPVQSETKSKPVAVDQIHPMRKEQRLAPDGIFYLLTRVSVETNDGIVGLNPGTVCRRLNGDSYMADGNVVTLQRQQITNDLDIVAQAINADQSAQSSLRQTTQAKPGIGMPGRAASPSGARPSQAQSTQRSTSSRSVASGFETQSGGLNSSTSLGSTHTRVKDGWVWQQDSSGQWVRIRPTGR